MLYTIVYREEWIIDIIADSEEEAIQKAENANHWKPLNGFHSDLLDINPNENYVEEECDCPQCGGKMLYITPNVTKCPCCVYFEIDCPNCGSNQFDSYCSWCKYKEEGYRDLKTLQNGLKESVE